jgi:hypothetical protein
MLKLKDLLARAGEGDDAGQYLSDPQKLEALLVCAVTGDESALPFIRELLDILPSMGDVFGAKQAEQQILSAIAGKNIVQREALERKLEQMRDELSGQNPQPLERLLIERVVLCWLHSHYADLQYGLAASISTSERSDYLQRQLDRAQRRYLAAIRCLANVRRLALPIKVDVALEGEVGTHPRPACRGPVEVGHGVALGSGRSTVPLEAVNGRARFLATAASCHSS